MAQLILLAHLHSNRLQVALQQSVLIQDNYRAKNNGNVTVKTIATNTGGSDAW